MKRLWLYRTDFLWSLLLATGFWRMRTEGGYYRDGTWCWRFWTPCPIPSCYDWNGRPHGTLFILRWPFVEYLSWVRN